jgi:CubicO group peptidase (beta-lactamase class C family)
MRQSWSRWLAIVGLLVATCVEASSPTAETLFKEWLAAYNANDAAALADFNQRRLGDPDTRFVLDSREETSGLDVVKVERNEPSSYVVLAKERSFPSYRRVSVELKDAKSGKTELKQIPQPLPLTEALASLNAFAQRLTASDRFSGLLVIEQNDRRLYQKAFGLANRQTGTPVTLDTPFFIASQGKMFTAVAILQLVEAGKVGLDDPVGKYLTDYPNRDVATKVTIRHLLTHTGGTGDIGILGPGEGANRAWVKTVADVLELNGARGPSFEPGISIEYSNYGFMLLGAIVQKVSGTSYMDYVREHVFGPAGMTRTGFPTRDELAGVAIGYMSPDGTLAPNTDLLPWRGLAAGGGVSIADDELRFIKALKAGKLISLPMLAEATRQQTPWYGYGFISSGPENFPHWGHGGGAPGMSLALAVYPTNNMTMLCMSNRDPIVCDRLLFNLHLHLAPPE